MHHRHQQGPAVPFGGADEGGAGVGGETVLHPDQARVLAEQPVGVGDPEAPALPGVLVHRARELRVAGRAVAPEVRVAQPRPGEQGQVVGRGHLAVRVVAVRRDHPGVPGLQRLRPRLHLGHGLLHAAVHVREDVHRVVPRAQEHPAPEVLDPVVQVLLDADQAAARADPLDLLGRDPVHGVAVELRQHGVGEEDLQCGGRGQPQMRVAGRQHLS